MNSILFKEVRWSAEAERLLAGSTPKGSTYTVNEMRQEVQAQRSSLKQVILETGGEAIPLGYVVVWVENYGSGRDLVIQAGAAFADTIKRVALVGPALVNMAKGLGCTGVRTHTNSPAFIRAWSRVGLERSEIVLRKDF